VKLVALILAGNSIEVLDGCIEHHRRLGVDAFAVLHIYSEDETPQRLRELAATHSDVHVIFADQNQILHGTPFRELEAYARLTFAPDWLIQIDCDERWFVREGFLKDVLTRSDEPALTVLRYNVVWAAPGEAVAAETAGGSLSLKDLPLAAWPVDVDSNADDPLHGIPWVLTRDSPKTCLRVRDGNTFALGAHRVLDAETSLPVPHRLEPDLLIAQLAFSTFERFERKVRFACWCLPRSAHLPRDAGWHWKRLARMSDEGQEALRIEWSQQFLLPIEAFRKVGRAVIQPGPLVFELQRQMADEAPE
jgi:hypothetical protein